MTDESFIAETSKEGARRMEQLQQAGMSCGPSTHAFIDPITSSLAYLAPASSQYRGHLVTTLASTLPPRQLPLGQPGVSSQDISISPDGKWVTIFHPHIGQSGGVLAMYSSTILSPVAVTGKVVPILSFNLSYAPLAMIHNHTSRLQTAQGRGRAIGPRPLVNDGSNHGPSITVVCADGIYLFHPFQSIDSSLIIGNGQLSWRMQMLKCPLHTRFRAVMGGQLADDTGLRAKRAWIGAVAASEAIWVGIEVEMEVRVIRVEYEQIDAGQFSMTTVPLPALPFVKAKPVQGNPLIESELQGLVFVSLSNETPVEVKEEGIKEEKPHSYSEEQVGAVQIFRDSSEDGTSCRTRFEACRIENREFELAEGFKELSNDHSDNTASWDWVTLSRSPVKSLSPKGWTILALHPLPSLRPPSLAMALLETPNGLMLSHLNLMDGSAETSPDETWTALRGSAVHIRDDVGSTDLSLCLSQGVSRGELGLIAIISKELGAILTLGPRLEPLKSGIDGDDRADGRAGDAARSISMAMEQDQNWTDAVRASLASVAQNERTAIGESIIRECHQQLQQSMKLDELRQLLGLQTAIYASLNDPRHTIASELVRLLEASYLFTRCATKGPGKAITFDLASVWPLITIAEWVGGILAEMLRSVISTRGQLEWSDGDLLLHSAHLRILYLVHPVLRSLIIRLHSQLDAFTHFALSIDRPIPYSNPRGNPVQGMVDPRATILAQANVVDVLGREGVNLAEWGTAIESLPPSPVSDSEITEAFLTLSCGPVIHVIPEVLAALPTPSALLRSTSRFSEHDYDGITYEPFGHDQARLARCDRCGWKTSAIGDQGWIGLGMWGNWRQEQEQICVCGGTWIRESKRMS